MPEKHLRVEVVPIDALVPWPGNPRRHGEDVKAIAKSIKAFGWTSPILAQRGSNRVIAGHGRILAAREVGIKEVPVIFLDIDERQATAYTIADNRLPENSEWDSLALKEAFAEIDDGAFDMELTGFKLDEVKSFFGDGIANDDDEPREPRPVKCPKCGEPFVPKRRKSGDE